MRQELRQKMSMQLIQSINLLPLTLSELKERIEEELENNPALEAADETKSVSLEEFSDARPEESAWFDESSDPGFSHRSYTPDDDSQRLFLEGALSRDENLHDHLISQLRLHHLSAPDFALASLLVNNLDQNGFHLEAPDALVNDPEQKQRIPELLDLIRSLEPQGCGVSDWRESLLVQMSLQHFFPEAERLITEFWDLLEKKKYREIALKLGVSEEEVGDLVEDLRALSPFPGRTYSQAPPVYVVPDASIQRKDGTLVLIFNEEEIPILRLDSSFNQAAELAEAGNKETLRFVHQKAAEAERFIQNLRFRKNTLFRVCRAIMEFQADFFRRGPKYLRPLTLKDVAQELELNESTISRVTTGKYVQTDWGIFELKYFFSNAVSASQPYSKEGVKQTIKEILEEHLDGKKLSDQKISDLLARRGIAIARRTVTKYRQELAQAES
jgi:RNA polymerase sigma-54 factor